jgi:uncharacterized protein YbcI
LIKSQIRSCLYDLINEQSTQAEREYFKLVELASMEKVGTPAYTQIGYKISLARNKKVMINRAKSDLSNQSEYQQLKEFVKSTFGNEVLEEFYHNLAKSGQV